MSEFKVGDRVKWVRDWSRLNLYTEYIGKEYTIDEIDVGYEYPYHLKEADLWIPGVALEKAEDNFKIGDKVFVVRDWTDEESVKYACTKRIDINNCIGNLYRVVAVCTDRSYKLSCSESQWFPECVLVKECDKEYLAGTWIPLDDGEKLKASDPAQDRFTLTIERFGTDGKKYMCGVADICEVEFYAMWDCYVA